MQNQQYINATVFKDSILKLNPIYLAKKNPVMFTVEIGFFLVLGLAPFADVSDFVNHNEQIYLGIATILILTVWFATYSEALSEAQAQAKVDSLKRLEKEVFAKKLEIDDKEISVSSHSLKVGDRVRIYVGEIIPRDGIVVDGKAFIDESMMTGESNPVFKEKDDSVIGGTKVASDNITVEITAEAGKSFLDQMVGLIQNATRPKTQNEIALTILLAGLSLIFITVVGTMFFFASYLGYEVDIAVLVALLVALMPTTIGGLLPAIGISGINRIARDNMVVKSGKGIEAAGDCDVLILDKTGTITEGARRAVAFVPMEKYTEDDVIQAAFAASLSDTTFEAKSIVELAQERNIEPPLLDQIITAKQIPFNSETKFSGIEFIRGKKFIAPQPDAKTRTKVSKKLCNLAESDSEVKILKGSVDAILKIASTVNEGEMRWKSQDISKNGGTPLAIAINDEVIGLVSLKDNLKENIKEKLNEVRSTGITTIMITGDSQLTAEVIAKEANIDQVVAEAKPTDKLNYVVLEQSKGHVIGMVGDGTNDAPALAKADIGLAMNRGTAAAREAANMIDLDSNPSKILNVVKLGKQLLMTRGAITTFSIANDVAKYFAILPALFSGDPKLDTLNVMQLHSPETAVLSTLIFNAIIIPFLIPLSLKGVNFKAEIPQKTFVRNMLIYGIGGTAVPFAGIKVIDLILSLFMV